MKQKLCSRKFWMATAAGLASLGTSIAGIATDNEILAGVGIACTAASAAIYAAAEAYVDGKAAAANTTTVSTNVQASTLGGTEPSRVINAVLPEPKAEKPQDEVA